MSDAVVDHIVAVLPPLLASLDALEFIARHLDPPDFDAVMEAAGTPEQALQAVRPRLEHWPSHSATCKPRWPRPAMRRSPHSRACAWCSGAKGN